MTKVKYIDINCDLGEGLDNEAALMPFITSCNLACGGHAGSRATVAQVIAMAKENQVLTGAHPSFPDVKNFGRRFIPMPIPLLRESLKTQINVVYSECERQEVKMHHIKPHGALYNRCAVDKAYGEMMVQLMESEFPEAKLYAPYRSMIAKIAKNRVVVDYEVFADRNYNADHTLVNRAATNALITNQEVLTEHILLMIIKNKIKTVTGKEIKTCADTLCMHSDTPGAVTMLQQVYEVLKANVLLKQKGEQK